MSYLLNPRPKIRWRMRWFATTSLASLLLYGGAQAAPVHAQGVLGPRVASMARTAPLRKETFIVQFKPSVSGHRAAKLVRSDGGLVTSHLPIIHGLAVRMRIRWALRLAHSPAIRAISLNGRVLRQDSAVDSSQLQPTAYDRLVQAPQSWNDGFSGAGVGVAVIDTGIAGDLPDFATSPTDPTSRVSVTAVTNPFASDPGDPYGHGTDVAGIIAGNGWNQAGPSGPAGIRGHYIGIAPQASLISIKAGDDQGNATVVDVINGIQFAIDHQADYNIRVINLSLSSDTAQSYTTDPLDAAVESAWFHGIVVVAAAGNRGTAADAVSYAPANDPYAITVGAVDPGKGPGPGDDAPASYSSQGTTQDGFAKPDIMAPGSHIVSTLAPNSAFAQMCPGCIVGGGYIRTSGTSMAAPVVSGAVALLLQKYPQLTPDQVKGALLAKAHPMPAAYKPLRELSIKPVLDHALDAPAANQSLTPSSSADLGSGSSNVSGTRSSWSRSSWSQAPSSLTATWARSSWSCTCSLDSSGNVDPTRSSWSRSTWSTDLTTQ